MTATALDLWKRIVRKRDYAAAWRRDNASRIEEYRKFNRFSPRRRAKAFMCANPDCTSTYKEIAKIYREGIDMTTGKWGPVGRGNDNLVLDHIHGGPAVGLIPSWLNRFLTQKIQDNAEVVVDYIILRQEKAEMANGK